MESNLICVTTNFLLTERLTEEYWPEVVVKTTEGQYSPVLSRASEVSKQFIIWHHFSYEKHFRLFFQVNFRRDAKERSHSVPRAAWPS